MSTTSFKLLGLLLCALLVGCADPQLACEDALGCVLLRSDDALVIAALVDKSGPAAGVSEEVLAGIGVAFGERGQELLGHPLELLEVDTNCRADSGAAAAQQLAADRRVIGVIGPLCAEAAETAVPVLDAAGMVTVSPADTGSTLPLTPSQPAAYFRTAPPFLTQGDLMAAFVSDVLDARTATVLYTPDTYLAPLALKFRSAFEARGGLVLYTDQIDAGQPDVTSAVATTAAVAPDIIYVGLFEPEALLFVAQIRENPALADTTFLGPDALLLDSFARGAGAAVDGMYVTGAAAAGTAYEAFLRAWAAQTDGSLSNARGAYAYDAALLLLDAIEAAAQVGTDESLLIGRRGVRTAVAESALPDGATGMLTCTAVGECAGGAALGVYRLLDRERPDSRWPPELVWSPAS